MRADVPMLLRALRINAERKGSMLWASCPSPLHDDSTASWRIISDPTNDRYGQHRCYGCGWGGYAVHLVEVVQGISREEAREWLRLNGNSGPLPTEVEVVSSMPRGYKGFTLPEGVVTASELDPLEWPRPVKRFLVERGVTIDQCRKWGLGFAGRGKLRGRIVIPIRDATGRLLSYTGRTFIGDELRYKDAHLKDGADLAAIFGAEYWPNIPGMGNLDPLVICEGAFNALAIERVAPGLELAALFGSNLVPLHLSRLAPFQRIVMATDPDNAGNRVAGELEMALRRRADIVRLELPPKKDCNDLPAWDLKERLQVALSKLPGTSECGTLHATSHPEPTHG